MAIHTKEKEKLHIKQEPEAKIKCRNVLLVDKGLKIAGMDKEDKTVIKKSSAKEAVKNSMQKEKGIYAKIQRAKQDKKKTIGKKNSTAKTVASASAMTTLAQMDGGNEVYESYQVARIYGVFNQVKCSKQSGEKCKGICHCDLWGLF